MAPLPKEMTHELLKLGLFCKFQSARCKFFGRVWKEEKREHANDFMMLLLKLTMTLASRLQQEAVRDQKSMIAVHEAPLVLPLEIYIPVL
jgi:hypothetical protein